LKKISLTKFELKMRIKICKLILKILGWKAVGVLPPEKKCILIGVPHTSAWDFLISYISFTTLGGNANVVIKKEFFFWPLGYFLRKMGGLKVDRSKGASLVRQIIKLFNEREYMHLAITPEGTRKLTRRWKAGFHIIARSAGVPVYLSSFDWGRKEFTIWQKFELTDSAEADIKRIKDFYRGKGLRGKHPDKFSTEY